MVSANRNEPLVPAFRVQLGGQDLTKDIAPWIVSVMVKEGLNLPSMFALQLISKEDETGTKAWTDAEVFTLGSEVKVSFGYGATLERVFSGEVTALEPKFSVGRSPTLTVRGFDKRHRLNRLPTIRDYGNLSDSEIARTIASDAMISLAPTQSRARTQSEQVVQNYETDHDFLTRLAKDIGYDLWMEDDTLHFEPMAHDQPSQLTLTLDDDLLEFTPRLALLPVTAIEVRGRNPRTKEPLRATARAGEERGKMGVRTGTEEAGRVLGESREILFRPVASQPEADELARARLNQAAIEYIQGAGSCRGRTDLRVSKVIRIDQLGGRFSGPYQVTSVIHSFTPGDGYITSFEVRRNAS